MQILGNKVDLKPSNDSKHRETKCSGFFSYNRPLLKNTHLENVVFKPVLPGILHFQRTVPLKAKLPKIMERLCRFVVYLFHQNKNIEFIPPYNIIFKMRNRLVFSTHNIIFSKKFLPPHYQQNFFP